MTAFGEFSISELPLAVSPQNFTIKCGAYLHNDFMQTSLLKNCVAKAGRQRRRRRSCVVNTGDQNLRPVLKR
jgi:hypothetical protein